MIDEAQRSIAASDVIPMFPTLVWKLLLAPGSRASIDRNLMDLLEQLRRDQPALAHGQGWQSEQALHERDEVRELASRILDVATRILRFLQIGRENVEITGCWATILAPGAMHRIHSHPNNFLSGVYYVRVQPGADTITFHDPRRQTYVIRPPVVALTGENTDHVVIRVANGTLLLFPSYLEHSVDANDSAEERISISFNLMFSSFTERLTKPLW